MFPSRFTTTVSVSLLVLASCGSSRRADLYRAREGDSCYNCDYCKKEFSGCVCETCTYYATDEAGHALLQCCSEKWVAIQHCPGGVTLSCSGHGAYQWNCLNATGQTIPTADFGTCTNPK